MKYGNRQKAKKRERTVKGRQTKIPEPTPQVVKEAKQTHWRRASSAHFPQFPSSPPQNPNHPRRPPARAALYPTASAIPLHHSTPIHLPRPPPLPTLCAPFHHSLPLLPLPSPLPSTFYLSLFSTDPTSAAPQLPLPHPPVTPHAPPITPLTPPHIATPLVPPPPPPLTPTPSPSRPSSQLSALPPIQDPYSTTPPSSPPPYFLPPYLTPPPYLSPPLN